MLSAELEIRPLARPATEWSGQRVQMLERPAEHELARTEGLASLLGLAIQPVL